MQQKSIVVAPIASLDAPARYCAQNIVQFNGKCGCSFCEHPGESYKVPGSEKSRHVYLEKGFNFPLRTHENMIRQANEASVCPQNKPVCGVKNKTVVSDIPLFDTANGFVPDYMHAVLLGVVRMLMTAWFSPVNKRKNFYVKKCDRKRIDKILLRIKPPAYITRAPRSIFLRNYWKASELRAFLLYYAPILMKGILQNDYYQHFLLLVSAINTLLRTELSANQIQLAESLLQVFVQDTELLYGRERCTFNLHQVTHLTHFVRLWEPLWAWSAFHFEDLNGYLKKINHGPNKIDIELVNTLDMINTLYTLEHDFSPKSAQRNSLVVATVGSPRKHEVDQQILLAMQEIP